MSRNTSQTTISISIGKIVAVLGLAFLLLLLPKLSYAAPAVPTVPTVPTVPPDGTPTNTPTVTPTPSVTPTPGPAGLEEHAAPNGKTIAYKVTFTNNTGATIHDGKIYFTVPPYTTLNFAQSDAGWQCPNGNTAGNICEFALGDMPLNATKVANFVLDVLVDQLPAAVKSIVFDIFVVDGSDKLLATYHANTALPDRPTDEGPVTEPHHYTLFLPVLYR